MIALALTSSLFFSAGKLLTECRARTPVCAGYIAGVLDSHENEALEGAERLVCLPAGTQSSDLSSVVVGYLERAKLSDPAKVNPVGGVVFALSRAYPCSLTPPT